MTIIEDQQAKYLIKSLQHHPSPYLILSKNTGIEWMNKSSQYVFDTSNIEETENDQGDVSLEEVSESENQEKEVSSDDSEPSNL